MRLIDLSNNNGPAAVAAIADKRVGGVFAKATQGLGYVDPLYELFRARARQLAKPFGGYLFLDPRFAGAPQARKLLSVARPAAGDLEPVVDSEIASRQAAACTLAALEELEAKGYRPLLYGSTYFLAALAQEQPRLRRFRVWQAEYGPVLHRIPGLNAIAWQFTDQWVVAKGRMRVDSDRLLVRDIDGIRIPHTHRPSPIPRPKPRPTPPLLKLGDRGPRVRRLQRLLERHGARIAVDGVFGQRTLASLRAFQKRAHLPVTGTTTKRTWQALQRNGGKR